MIYIQWITARHIIDVVSLIYYTLKLFKLKQSVTVLKFVKSYDFIIGNPVKQYFLFQNVLGLIWNLIFPVLNSKYNTISYDVYLQIVWIAKNTLHIPGKKST